MNLPGIGISKHPQPLGPTASPAFTGLTLSGLTQGAVPFAGAGGVISQDASSLFWDAPNKKLSIGHAVPLSPVHIKQPVNTPAGGIIIERSGAALNHALWMDVNNNLNIGYGGGSALLLSSLGNLLLGLSAAGTSAQKVLALATGAAPTTSPADAVQLFSVDKAAGRAVLGIRCEDGVVSYIEQNLDKSAFVDFAGLTLTGAGSVTPSTIKGGTSAAPQEWVGLAVKRNTSGSDTEALVGFYDRLPVSEDYAGAIGSKRRSTNADYSLIFKVKNAADALGTAEVMRLNFRGNLMLGGTTDNPGSATRSIVLYNGTAPSGNVTDGAFLYSADQAAGNACIHARTEGGKVIKLFQQAHIADPTGGATIDSEARTAINAILAALEGTGLLAAA